MPSMHAIGSRLCAKPAVGAERTHVLVFDVGADPGKECPQEVKRQPCRSPSGASGGIKHQKELEDPHGPRSTARGPEGANEPVGHCHPCHPCPLATPSPAKGRHPRRPHQRSGERHFPWRRAEQGRAGPAMWCGPGGPCCLHDAIRARIAAEKKAKLGRSAHPFSRVSSAKGAAAIDLKWKFRNAVPRMVDANFDARQYLRSIEYRI